MKSILFLAILLLSSFSLCAQFENLFVENNAVDGKPIAIRGYNTGANLGMFNEIGVLGESLGTGAGWNIGTYGSSIGSGGPQVGVLGNSFADSNQFRLGVLGQVGSSTENGVGIHRAVQGEIFGESKATQRIAVAGIVTESGASMATANGDIWAGYFQGDVCVLGTVFHNGLSNPGTHLNSIAKKSNHSVLTRLNNLDLYATTNKKTNKRKIEFHPDNLEKEFPGLVTEFTHYAHDKEHKELVNSKTLKGIDYNGIIPVLTKAIQEQQANIDLLVGLVGSLQHKIEILESQVGISKN